MSWRIVLFMILTMMFSLPYFIFPTVFANAEDAWVQISCSTQNRLSLGHLSLSFIIYENNSILLVGWTRFEAIGNQPILTIRVDSSGRAPLNPSGIVTADVVFFMVNGTREYYVGAYYDESFHVNATVNDGIVDYEINFASNVEKAMNAIPPEGTIDDFGIRGTITFSIVVRNSVVAIKQKRFFKVLPQIHADLDSVTYDVSLPQKLTALIDAKKGEQDMQKIAPYRVYTSFDVTPFEFPEGNLYLEWEMPEEIHLLTRIISHPIFTLVIGSIGGSIVGRYVLLRISERRQKKQLVKKLIMELEGIKKDISGRHSITTTIYDSSTSKLLLFSDETAEIVKKTYDEIKRYETPIPFTSDEIEQLLQKINATIDALRREL